uniref:F-box domain-containing protein n=1 Tax=Glossina austeni TaxID=7395 RepID=A0A1A9UYI4_GLOAU
MITNNDLIPRTTLIFILNDDCLEYVCKYLELRDKIQFARVCKRFQNVFMMTSKIAYKMLLLDDMRTCTLWQVRQILQMIEPFIETLNGEIRHKQWMRVAEFLNRYSATRPPNHGFAGGGPTQCSRTDHPDVRRTATHRSTGPADCAGRRTTVRHHRQPPRGMGRRQDGTHLCFEVNRISVTNIIAGQWVAATVDTGATISFLAETFVEQLEERYKRTTHRANIFLTDGTPLKTDNTFTCAVHFEKRTTLGSLHLAEAPPKRLKFTERTAEKIRIPERKDDLATTEELKFTKRTEGITTEPSTIANTKKSKFLRKELPKLASLQEVTNKRRNQKINCEWPQIKTAYSSYSSPITLARKKNGVWQAKQPKQERDLVHQKNSDPRPAQVETALKDELQYSGNNRGSKPMKQTLGQNFECSGFIPLDLERKYQVKCVQKVPHLHTMIDSLAAISAEEYNIPLPIYGYICGFSPTITPGGDKVFWNLPTCAIPKPSSAPGTHILR